MTRFISIFILVTLSLSGNVLPSKKITYRESKGVPLELHVFNPDNWSADQKNVAIIFFSGGQWDSTSKDQFYRHAAHYASKGLVAICADYRTEEDEQATPADALKDGKAALRWVRSHAKELGIDSEKMIACGASAGGHIAFGAAILEQFNHPDDDTSIQCQPNALILFHPYLDSGPTGYQHEKVKEYWEEFSLLENLKSNIPPILLIHGENDSVVPPELAQRLQKEMNEKHLHCDLLLFKNQGHGFFDQELHPSILAEMDFFLMSFGYLTGVSLF